MSEILEDIVSEGERLLGIASRDGVPLRLLGGIAVRLKAPSVPASLDRAYKDIDFAVTKKGGGAADKLLKEAGYEPHVAFNAMHARERGLYYDDVNGRQVDLFIDAFRMCHEIPLGKRLDGRDRHGAAGRADAHEAPDHRAQREGHPRHRRCCSTDTRSRTPTTARSTARTSRGCAPTTGACGAPSPRTWSAAAAIVTDYELPDEDRARIEQRFDQLLERIEAEPKSRGWRRRAKVGDKKRWYELPGGGRVAMRMFFATDIHGSEVCWKKFLNSGAHYKADVVVLGGDMTGKALVPVIDDGGGKWHSTLLDNREMLDGEDAVKEFEAAVIRRGYYPFRTDPDELRELSADEPRWHALFEEHMLNTVERWMEMADERLARHRHPRVRVPGQRRPARGRRGRRQRQDGRARRGSRRSTSTASSSRPAAGPTARRGTRTARRTRTSCSSASSGCSPTSRPTPSTRSSASTARRTTPGSTRRRSSRRT